MQLPHGLVTKYDGLWPDIRKDILAISSHTFGPWTSRGSGHSENLPCACVVWYG